MVNALVAEIAHQSAGEAGQLGNFGRFETGVELFDNVQRVAFVRFGKLVVAVDFGGAAGNFEISVARQADEGIAPEAFAAHHGFEQVGKRAVGEFQVKRQGRVQIGQQLLDEGDAVAPGCGVGEVLGFGNHGRAFLRRTFRLPENVWAASACPTETDVACIRCRACVNSVGYKTVFAGS